MNIKKLIPWKIKITSLYWVEKEQMLDTDFNFLFEKIDNDDYSWARNFLDYLYDKWHDELKAAPKYFVKKFYGETSKATGMLDFLETPFVE